MSNHTTLYRGDEVIGHVSHHSPAECENHTCEANAKAGREWHAMPMGFAVPMPTYDYATEAEATAAVEQAMVGIPGRTPSLTVTEDRDWRYKAFGAAAAYQVGLQHAEADLAGEDPPATNYEGPLREAYQHAFADVLAREDEREARHAKEQVMTMTTSTTTVSDAQALLQRQNLTEAEALAIASMALQVALLRGPNRAELRDALGLVARVSTAGDR